jgi:copper transport protein
MLKLAAAGVPLSTPDLWLTGLERWLMLIGLTVALGGLAGRAIARHYKGTQPGPLPDPWALRGSLLGLAASAAMLLTAAAGGTLANRLAQPPAPGLDSRAPTFIAVVELALFALAALSLWLRQPGWGGTFLCGVVLAEGVRAHPEGIVPVAGALLTYCHLLPAMVWVGMLFYVLRAAIGWRADPGAVQGVIQMYSKAAAWLFSLVVITGIVSALVLVPLRDLFTTSYGLFLVAKAVLVAVIACLAIAGQAWLRHRPVPGAGPALATKLELAGLVAVLAITSILTVMTPPAKPIRPSHSAAPVHVSQQPRAASEAVPTL